MSGLQIMYYVSILFFFVMVIAKMIRIARMPVHLRWDLYPIPHEKGKEDYGGSYYEEVDWWLKPKQFSLINEVKEMVKEIVFIQSVFKHNRPLWFFTFPFHFGLYCIVGFAFLLFLGAGMGAAGITVSATSANGFAVLVHYLTWALGGIGSLLAVFGGLGLLLMRLGNYELRSSAVFSDYANLLFLIAIFGTGLWGLLTADPGYEGSRAFVQNIITFTPVGEIPAIMAIHVWLVVGLFFYFPFTHMTHMVAKYFTYHTVRWGDEPNTRDSQIEQSVQEALGYTVTWSAPHVKTGGTWAEAATAPEEDDKNE
jgi:nitrate reductase gamma subunit